MVIEWRTGNLSPQLLDFGIAKMSRYRTVYVGVVPNTPTVRPSFSRGVCLSARSD